MPRDGGGQGRCRGRGSDKGGGRLAVLGAIR